MLIDSIKGENLNQTNAAELYIKSLQSNKSKILMASRLNIISKMMCQHKDFIKTDWSTLTYEIALNILEKLKNKNKSPSTINSYLSAIKGTAKQAWKLKNIKTSTYLWINEIAHIKGNRISEGRSLEIEEIKKLINACEKCCNNKGKRDAAIIALTYGAGLRRDETVKLKIKDYDKYTGTIIIKGKGNKERKNKINKSIKKILDEYIELKKSNCEFLFQRINNNECINKRLSGDGIYQIIKKRYKQAGIKKLSPHDLRRTYATKLLENGEDLFIVQELMGHSDVNTTKRYDKRADIFKDNAAQSLPF